jgi:hypothetical protein
VDLFYLVTVLRVASGADSLASRSLILPTLRDDAAARYRRAMLVLALVAAANHTGRAQSVGAPSVRRVGMIDGVVSDTALAPIANATVSILGTELRVVTGENGRFRIAQLPLGTYFVFVRRIGLEAASAAVQVVDSDAVRVSFGLRAAATKLDERREFAAKFGGGQFMNQDEIEKRNTVFATELIRTFRGISVGYALVLGQKGVPIATSGRAPGSINQTCMPTIWLDGVLLPIPTNLDNLPSPKAIAGIEVYPGPASVPPRYAAGGMSCGAILIWTRDGS